MFEYDSLETIESIVLEIGLLPDYKVFSDKNTRKSLASNNPEMFLSVSSDGTPTFPIRNQYGGVSYSVLRRSMSSAVRLYKQTGDERYADIVRKIEHELDLIHARVNTAPEMYHLDQNLNQILRKF